jgi:hypothetical protein
MKKSWSLLFIITVLAAFLLTACGKPIERDPIYLESWLIGQVKLAPNGSIAEAINVVFWNDNNPSIDPKDIKHGVWVSFVKNNFSEPALFVVETDRSQGINVATYLQFAKPANPISEESICPDWAANFMGFYCEYDTRSVH